MNFIPKKNLELILLYYLYENLIMKKLNNMIITFFLILLTFSSFSKNKSIRLKFDIGNKIALKYKKLFYDVAKFWINQKTIYKAQATITNLQINLILKQKTTEYILEADLKTKDGKIIKQTHITFSNLSDYFDALDTIFYKNFFKDKLVKKNKKFKVIPSTFDIAFLVDSTGSMKEEIAFIKEYFTEIFSNIFKNLKTYKLRFALLDYKTTIAPYRAHLENFTPKLKKFKSRLNEISTMGQGKNDLNYALKYLLNYGDFISDNRIVFIIADSGPVNKKEFILLANKARKMKVKIVLLAADGMTLNDKTFLKNTLTRFSGNFYTLNYYFTFLLKDMSLKKFIYHNYYLWELYNKKEIDLTLGRKITQINKIENFLKNEGYQINTLKNLYINIAELFNHLTSTYRKKLPIAQFKSKNYLLNVEIQDNDLYHYLKKKIDKKLVIGGQFFPYFDKISIIPYTFHINNNYIPNFLIQDIIKIDKNSYFYFNNGIFEPSIWYIKATFKGFK